MTLQSARESIHTPQVNHYKNNRGIAEKWTRGWVQAGLCLAREVFFFHWEEKGTMGNRQDKFWKGEVCRCSRERGCRVKLSERSAEAGGDCCGEDIVEFSGNLAGEDHPEKEGCPALNLRVQPMRYQGPRSDNPEEETTAASTASTAKFSA